MLVSRFGLHIAPGDIPFLLQPTGAVNLISPELRSPFELHIRPRNARCPHAIDLSGAATDIPAWVDEPLAQLFVPTPGFKAGLLYDPRGEHLALLQRLCRLSSPVEPLMQPVWWKHAQQVHRLYTVTNLGPLVWMSCDGSNVRNALRHITLAEANHRRILIVAREQVPIFEPEPVEPFDLPEDAPLEAIGAAVLRREMENAQAA